MSTNVSAFYKSSILIGLDKFVSIQQLPLDVNRLRVAQLPQQFARLYGGDEPSTPVVVKDRLFVKIAESRDYTIFEEQPT